MIAYSDEPSNRPVYEILPSKYTADRILRILLDPKIPDCKVCKVKPGGVKSSATFVVDVGNLKCVDDIKKDDLGIWNYSGSHPQAYMVCHSRVGMVQVGETLCSCVAFNQEFNVRYVLLQLRCRFLYVTYHAMYTF